MKNITLALALTCTLAAAARPVPKEALANRLANEDLEVIGIVHWGPNTYAGHDWGYGDENPAVLNPEAFDADQIVGACRAGGLGGLVVVCKHHDGLCLWPTKTTEHNISKTPFRGGKGDYVREMSDACRRAGVAFGVYVSPWDRNNAHYGTPEYVKIFHEQIRELLSGDYGDVFEMWFDGANGGDGYYGGAREVRRIAAGYYRFDEVFSFVRALQSKVTIFAGEEDDSDFRWPGNEMGALDPDSRATVCALGGFANGKYENHDYYYQINIGSPCGTRFRVCEGDFPLRTAWFYDARHRGQTKKGAYLMKCYLSTVGNGGIMDIGIAPNRRGLLDDEDVKALAEFKNIRTAFFADEVKDGSRPFNVVVMRENLSKGEQVDGWALHADGKPICRGKCIGRKRIRILDQPVTAKALAFTVHDDGGEFQGVEVTRYYVNPTLVKTVREATTTSGETDTALWMTGAQKERRTLRSLQQDFVDLRFGMFTHFGMPTYSTEDWPDPDMPASAYNPTALDCTQWARAAKSAKMSYGCLTTKHHSGFCLWPTKTTDYSVAASPVTRDVVREYADAFRAEGLKVMFYYSILDTHHRLRPHWIERRHVEMIKAQLKELLTGYGEVTAIILDGWDAPWSRISYEEIPFREIYDWIKSFQPNCLVMDLNSAKYPPEALFYSDIKSYEQGAGQMISTDANALPALACLSLQRNWFWHEGFDRETPKDARWLVEKNVVPYNRAYCNFILNVAPNRKGLIDENCLVALREIGTLWKNDAPAARLPDVTAPILNTNLAKGQRSFASWGWDTQIMDFANDDDFTTGWRSEDSVARPWWQVEFDGRQRVNCVAITELKAGGIRHLRLSARADGAWKTIYEGEAPTCRVKILRFPTVAAEALKVEITEKGASPVGIAEFGAYLE